MPQSNVVITGIGVVSSIGIGGDAYFQSLLEKKSGITSLAQRVDDGPKPDERSEPAGLWIGGPILDFNPKEFVRPRKALKVMCREIQTAFAASHLAVEQAGLGPFLPADPAGDLKPSDIGTVFGTEMYYGPPSEMVDAMRSCTNDDGTVDESRFGTAVMKNVMPLWMLKYLPNMPACQVGISLNAQGPNNTLVLGDISGPAAVTESVSYLDRGLGRVMLAGSSGTRLGTTRMNYSGDVPIGDRYHVMERSSRPFDPEARGVIGGEGAATVVLEPSQSVAARDGKPVARLVSYASRFVPSGNMTSPEPTTGFESATARGSRRSIELAIKSALDEANIQPDQIGLVISHAMGDPCMDHQESEALAAAVPNAPVTAPISAVGHTGAASGMIGLATGVLAIAHQTIPPTHMTETTPRDVGLVAEAQPLGKEYVLVVSHTSHGNATALLLATP